MIRVNWVIICLGSFWHGFERIGKKKWDFVFIYELIVWKWKDMLGCSSWMFS